jgi:hypothetical protein
MVSVDRTHLVTAIYRQFVALPLGSNQHPPVPGEDPQADLCESVLSLQLPASADICSDWLLPAEPRPYSGQRRPDLKTSLWSIHTFDPNA